MVSVTGTKGFKTSQDGLLANDNCNNVDQSRQGVKLYLKCAPFLTKFLFSSEQTFLQERSTRMMGMDEGR